MLANHKPETQTLISQSDEEYIIISTWYTDQVAENHYYTRLHNRLPLPPCLLAFPGYIKLLLLAFLKVITYIQYTEQTHGPQMSSHIMTVGP